MVGAWGGLQTIWWVRFKLKEWAIILLMLCYVVALVLTSHRVDSSLYLLSSIFCAALAGSICKRRPDLIMPAIRYFLWLNVAAIFIGLVAQFIFSSQNFIFILSDTSDYLRFRGISVEPNHLGLSLIVIYIATLFLPSFQLQRHKREFYLNLILIWIMAALTASMFTIPCLIIVTLIYGWTSTSRKIKSVAFIVIVLLSYVTSDRFERTISGEDNSANLRTWGSLSIAHAQVVKCGISGCGLGSARSVLENEPQMMVFAAHELNGLPNLFAGAMVEGGYFFVAFILLLIIFASVPFGGRGEGRTWRCSLACFSLLFLCAISGSHPYDSQFWSLLGLISIISRQAAQSDRKVADTQLGLA
jgi:hypothetical protein